MAWALFDPTSVGEYYPDASYNDWKPRLEAYFNDIMTDDDRAKYDNWSVNYTSKVAYKFSNDAEPLKEHEKPKVLTTRSSYRSLSPIIEMTNGLLGVDETLRGIIESLEPGVHQFWPMQVVQPKGKEYPKQYYGMIIRQFFDSFVPEESPEDVLYASGNYEQRRYSLLHKTKAAAGQIAMNSGIFGKAHLWREKRLLDPNVFISNELKDKIDGAGLRIFKHHRVKTIEA